MSAFRPNYFPPSNRRRCVKGRSSYIEPSDHLLSAAVSEKQNNGVFCQNEESYMNSVESDDGEEEPITIDLSAFLNDNPLLAQAAFESCTENNVAATESSSQFRVTDCKVEPSEAHKTDISSVSSSVDVNRNISENCCDASEKIIAPLDTGSLVTINDNVKENCLSPEKILSNVINSEPAKNITLNGNKSVVSPLKKFPKTRPLGLSNPLKKYKNFMKSKDLNKTNEKVFGKYPVVKCEKLDIENFVKNNKIKVSNWPLLLTECQKNKNFINKSPIKKKINLNKSTLKPKFMRKSIQLNKYLINSNKNSALNNNVNSVLGDHRDVTKPIIIKTDSWKPGVANASPCVPTFFRNFIKTSTSTPKTVDCDLSKFISQSADFKLITTDTTAKFNVITPEKAAKFNVISPEKSARFKVITPEKNTKFKVITPEKEVGKITNTFVTNINKLFSGTKNYQLIAPKPTLQPPTIIMPSHTKPAVGTILESVSDNYTVIEPYVEDPLSPQKPKPILTVPVEVLTSEKQNPVVNSSVNVNADVSEKAKTGKSVFLNGGAFKQISIPSRIKKDSVIVNKDNIKKMCDQENILDEVSKPVTIKEKDIPLEESPTNLKATNVVVDAMQSVFSSTQKKKSLKPRIVKKEPPNLISADELLGTSSYSSILNDNILNGFSENDFEDVSFLDDDSFENIPHDILTPPRETSDSKEDKLVENSVLSPRSIKIARKRKKHKHKLLVEDSPDTTSTLSASECENEDSLKKDIFNKKRKVSYSRNNSENIKSSVDVQTQKHDSPINVSVESVHLENSHEPDNKKYDTKHVDLSPSFSNLENITESHDNKVISSEITKQSEISDIPLNETHLSIGENSPVKCIKENNLLKQETCTRALRERKCSSTEVKLSNSPSKQTPHIEDSLEKTKIKRSINSKLKIQLKSPKNSTKAKIKRKSSKPEDIIREINTITGGQSVSKRVLNKNKKLNPAKSIKNSDLSNINNDSNYNSSSVQLASRQSHLKKGKSVRFCKRSNKKKNSCMSISLNNSLTDVIENANTTDSVSENNLNLHSSFREAKGEKMGTRQKEENSPENCTSVSDCNMELEKDEELIHKEQLPANSQDPLVTSDTSVLEDSVVNSDVNISVSDTSFLVENQKYDEDPFNEKESNIASPKDCDISASLENNSECAESLIDKISCADVEFLPNQIIETSNVMQSTKNNIAENVFESISPNGNDNLVDSNQDISDVTESIIEEYNENSHNTNVKHTSEVKDENDSETCESKILKLKEDSVPKECEVAITEKEIDNSSSISNSIEDNICNDSSEVTPLPSTEPLEKSVSKTEIEENASVDLKDNECESDIENCHLLSHDVEDASKHLSEIPDDPAEHANKEIVIEEDLENISHDSICTVSDSLLKDDSSKLIKYDESFDVTSEIELLECTEIGAVVEGMNDNINVASSSFQDSSENLEKSEDSVPCVETISEEKSLSPRKSDERDNSVRAKKCPKLKICKKPDGDSPDSLKNWFVSESNEVEVESVLIDREVIKSKSVYQNVSSSIETSNVDMKDSNSSLEVQSSSEIVFSDECESNTATSMPLFASDVDNASIASFEKTDVILHNKHSTVEEDSSLSNKNLVVNDKRSEDQLIEKSDGTLLEEIPLPENKFEEKDISTTESPLTTDDKTLPKPEPWEKEVSSPDLSLVIKEEPMDVEENNEKEEIVNTCILENQTIKTEPVEGKKKRGRTRKSADVNTSLDIKDIKTPKKEEAKISVTPLSTGRNKKTTPKLVSTPNSSGVRRKNYDPELVTTPFSMGWMREHVIRATGRDDKRMSDIYYFSPEGTKLRSMPDIVSYLSRHPQIKLSAENFTFAKELIFREPFEIERDAKQATIKKVNVTPKKTPGKTPTKASPLPQKSTPSSLSENITPSSNSKKIVVKRKSSTPSGLSENITPASDAKKKIVTKRKSSSSNETKLSSSDSKSSPSKIPKNSKQAIKTQCLSDDSEQQASSKILRSSRKIVKKVPFDNSLEKKFSKKQKSDPVVSKTCNENNTVNSKKDTEVKKPLILKLPVKSSSPLVKSSSSVIKESELKNSSSSDSQTNELPVKSVSAAKSNLNETLLSRTSIKSPIIQNRLKVKLAPRKPLHVLHKPCTKYCNFSYIREPTVKCCICLCLFHPECIPFKPMGLTKFACVPCVQTQIDSSTEMPEEIFFPIDFDIEMLYPSISMEILSDPDFNSTYNKFFSPVDHSFVASNQNSAISCQQPLHTFGVKNVGYFVKKSAANPLYAAVPRLNKNVWFPPISFTVPNMPNKRFQIVSPPIPIQRNANNNNQNVYTANQGSLPLLQNFSNSFFIQNQPSNKAALNTSVNFQNSFNQLANGNLLPITATTNANVSHLNSAIMFKKMPSNQQIHNMPSNHNVQNIADISGNTSVLQAMLQTVNSYSNSSCDNSSFQNLNNSFTLKSGDVAFSPIITKVVGANSNDSSEQISTTIYSESNSKKRKSTDSSEKTAKILKYDQSIESGRSNVSASSSKNVHRINYTEQLSACWNMNKFAQIYECLNFIFKFLNVSDLLRASLVCRSWNHLASQKLLWENICFTGMSIKDWVKCTKALQHHGTKYIDFRGLYNQDSTESWNVFCENVNRFFDVEELVFEKVPPFVVKKIADSLPQLRKLTCYCLTSVFTEPEIWSTPCVFELATLRYLGRLEALKISSMGGIRLKDNQESLMPYLPNLTHVVLTGFKFSSCMNLECLSQMQQLITLELGDCVDIEPQIYGMLAQLTNLQNLCLQNGGDIDDEKLSDALLKMNNLKNLELMNFQVSCHLPGVLKNMDTLQHFSLWPDNTSKAEQVNFNSYKAATSCTKLKSLCWGILTDDDSVPKALQMKDKNQSEKQAKMMNFEELFQSLVKHYPGVKVELKCLPRSIWSEFCSMRSFT